MKKMQERAQKTPHDVLQRAWNSPIDGKAWKNKRELLIAHGTRMFHRRGVNGTGVAEVLAEANMGKSQFYHYFTNKDAFVSAVLESEMEFFLTRVAPETTRLRKLADFQEWFQPYLALADLPDNLGCPVGVIASEMSVSTPEVRDAVVRCLRRWQEAIAEGFASLKEGEGLREDFDPHEAADFSAASIQGALLLGRAFRTNQYILQARERLQEYLDSFRVYQPSRS